MIEISESSVSCISYPSPEIMTSGHKRTEGSEGSSTHSASTTGRGDSLYKPHPQPLSIDTAVYSTNYRAESDSVRGTPYKAKSLLEVDPESLIAPSISLAQSSARYAAAAVSKAQSSQASSTPSPSSDDETSVNGIRDLTTLRSTSYSKNFSKARRHGIQHRQDCSKPVDIGAGKGDLDGLPQTPNKKHGRRNSISFALPSFQLPSLPNVSLSSFITSTGSNMTSAAGKNKHNMAKSSILPRASSGVFSLRRESPQKEGKGRTLEPPPTLRRASSVSSLSRVSSSLSRAPTIDSMSSLWDDSKFQHIHSPTNSRLKAIKDNLLAGLPNMPTLPHLQQHLANLNPLADTSEYSLPPLMQKSPALEAIDTVKGDVVILGGYRGSILRDTTDSKRIWIPLKVGFNLRKVDLELGLESEDEENAVKHIRPDGMLKSISGVDISRRLIRRLRNGAEENGRRVHDWGYDWRLSPALIAKRLISFLETLPCNKRVDGEDMPPNRRKKGQGALVIAHSLGGLIVRNAVNQRPELFSGVLYAGTPTTCVNILGPLRNGDSILFNSKVFSAQVNFTLRSSYIFLPENGHCFIDRRTGKDLPIDFFDVDTWRKYGLSPCVSDIQQNDSSFPQPISKSFNSNTSSIFMTLKKPILPVICVGASGEKEKDNTLLPPIQTQNLPPAVTKGAAIPLNRPSDQFPAVQFPPSQSPSPTMTDTTITIPKSKAMAYLSRTLSESQTFRQGLSHRPELDKIYPHMAVLYSKTTPTVRGALVDGLDGIKRNDAYDELVFGAGDGVCLARAAMLPQGYKCVAKVQVDRGHISLLGELEGVGYCLIGLIKARGW